jgi:microcystin degradation protein MlrC
MPRKIRTSVFVNVVVEIPRRYDVHEVPSSFLNFLNESKVVITEPHIDAYELMVRMMVKRLRMVRVMVRVKKHWNRSTMRFLMRRSQRRRES